MPKKKNNKKQLNSFFKASRWLHVYCSTFLFALLMFFSITGIFLNHSWYHQDGNKEFIEEIQLSTEQTTRWNLEPEDRWQPDTTALTEFLRQKYGLGTPSSIDIDPDVGELIIDYTVPAGYATVTVDTYSGIIFVEKETGSAIGILNDLHKGRHSGGVWAWVIDISASLICLFSLTGIIILFQGKKYTKVGLLSALGGLLTPLFLYLICVPSLGQ